MYVDIYIYRVLGPASDANVRCPVFHFTMGLCERGQRVFGWDLIFNALRQGMRRMDSNDIGVAFGIHNAKPFRLGAPTFARLVRSMFSHKVFPVDKFSV